MSRKKMDKMKRWVMMAFILTLGLSLTSCSPQQPLRGEFIECGAGDDPWWFDVKIEQVGGSQYELSIYVVQVTADPTTGQEPLATIGLFNSAENYYPLMIAVSLVPGDELKVRFDASRYQLYDQLAIQPYVAGVDQKNVVREENTLCELPYLADGNSSDYGY